MLVHIYYIFLMSYRYTMFYVAYHTSLPRLLLFVNIEEKSEGFKKQTRKRFQALLTIITFLMKPAVIFPLFL